MTDALIIKAALLLIGLLCFFGALCYRLTDREPWTNITLLLLALILILTTWLVLA